MQKFLTFDEVFTKALELRNEEKINSFGYFDEQNNCISGSFPDDDMLKFVIFSENPTNYLFGSIYTSKIIDGKSDEVVEKLFRILHEGKITVVGGKNILPDQFEDHRDKILTSMEKFIELDADKIHIERVKQLPLL